MIGDEAESSFGDLTTMQTPNVLRELISFSIKNNNEGPVDNEFVKVKAILDINQISQNEQNGQNDEIDRQKTEVDVEGIHNRDAQISAYLRATEENYFLIYLSGMMD